MKVFGCRMPLVASVLSLVFLLSIPFLLQGCIGGGNTPGVASQASNLSGLEVLHGTEVIAISPAFDPSITEYAVSVGGATSSIQVRATPADPKATIRINNVSAVGGVAFGPIDLNSGSNTVNVVVDIPGSTRAYLVTIVRGTNANLASLTIAPGSLAEAFDPNVLTYSATVGNASAQVIVTATLADSASSLTIKGEAGASGQPSSPIPLNVGSNQIDVVVTPLNGPSKTYRLVVTRSASALADLSNLLIVNGGSGQNLAYNPTFSSETSQYTTQQVSYSTSTVRVTATVTDPTATLAIQPPGQAFQPATSGMEFGPITLPNLPPTPNSIGIRVTAQNGLQKVYVVDIPRAAPSSNTNLQALTLSSGELAPSFTASTLAYQVSVTNAVTSVTVTATAQEATARVQINNQTPELSSASVSVPINVGISVPIVVIAEDGSTKSYAIAFNRSANLLSLGLSAGPLQPVFTSSTLAYSVSVSNVVTSTTVTAKAETPGSTMQYRVNGGTFTPLLPDTPSPSINLNLGPNTITVRVTAAVGSFQDYVVTVTRAAPGNVALGSLTVSSGQMTPAFNASVLNYAVNVEGSTASLTVTASAQDAASTTVLLTTTATPPGGPGQPSPLSISPLASGTTTVSIVVTHVAGNSQTYTLTITKNSADLTSLSVTANATNLPLTPTFSSATLSYAVTVAPGVTSVTITAVPVAGATVAVTGGTSSGTNQFTVTMPPLQNPIPVIVTPSGGPPSTTYKVDVH